MEFLKDTRSFFGAFALLIVGLLISISNLFYFYREYFGDDIFMSRWWWEIALNAQILCFALMWYAYTDRLSAATGAMKRKVIIHFCAGMLAVSAPIVLLMLGAFTDWFRQLAVRENIIAVHYVFTFTWLISTVLQLLIRQRNVRHQFSYLDDVGKLVVKFWSGLTTILLLAIGAIANLDFVYVLTPFFGYLQGALPYLRRAFREGSA